MRETLYTKVLTRHSTHIFQSYNEFNPKKIKNVDSDDNVFSFDYDGLVPVIHPYKKKFTLHSYLENESDFLKNYGNPLATVEMIRTSIYVEYYDSKTVIKVFQYVKSRDKGSKFFKKSTSLRYIGFNTKTNTFYSGYITNYHKKRNFSKAIRKNSFWKSPCDEMKIYLINAINGYHPGKQVSYSTPIGHPATHITNEVFQSFFKKLNINQTPNLSEDDLIYKSYLDTNSIKYSNNWSTFRKIYPAPTKKDLKKYKNKFIDTFMGMRKLSGDKLKRVLHKVESIEIGGLDVTFSIFGKDYILSQDDNVIKKIIETKIYHGIDCTSQYLLDNPKEKHNAFEIFKLILNDVVNINTFYDHIRFLNRLRPSENVKWKSNTYESFLEEHNNWTERLESYNKGNFKRIYSGEFKKTVETPIVTKHDIVYPKLLTNSREYNYESFIQSNCVKTYLKTEDSVIVSLRKGDVESKDRATIEYKIWYNGDRVIKLNRIQSLGRFNCKLDDTWDYILECFDKRIDDLVNRNMFELPSAILEVGNRKFSTKIVVDNDDRYRYNIPSGEILTGLKWDCEILIKNPTLDNELVYLF